jgi:hypothetical protein
MNSAGATTAYSYCPSLIEPRLIILDEPVSAGRLCQGTSTESIKGFTPELWSDLPAHCP